MSEDATLGRMLETVARAHRRKEALRFGDRTISFRELEENASKTANGLAGLGLGPGDRIALMLPNIPEFVYAFFGIQKLGAVAVPFNTLYKGREILHILNDSEARALITLTHFAPLINEVREEAPALEHVILTGQRTLVYVTPESTAAVLLTVGADEEPSGATLTRRIGEVLAGTLQALGVAEARYRHRGGVRVGGRKIGTVLVSGIETLWLVQAFCFLAPLDTGDLFQAVWVPPEIRDKMQEPMTSVEEETGARPPFDAFREAFLARLRDACGIACEPGSLRRDERFGYERALALAAR